MANDDGGDAPDYGLRSRYHTLLDQHSRLGRELAEMLPAVIIDLLREVLPGSSAVEVHGQINEDWLTVLRVERVLDAAGGVLFDVATGHPDRAVEDLIDRLDTEFLDHLVYLAPDAYLGRHTLGGDHA
ncbi:MAG: hypothetical protein U5K29_15885 [Acidimicrobiales bacterium]|nr:hypothetical protein [Acidimicrobiales bacterium]